MSLISHNHYSQLFTNCRRILGSQIWGRVLAALDENSDPQQFPSDLLTLKRHLSLPAYIDDLARVEWALNRVQTASAAPLPMVEKPCVNPDLILVPVSWKNLDALVQGNRGGEPEIKASEGIHIMIWLHPETGSLHIREAADEDLLALKITAENIGSREAAATGGVPLGVIDAARRHGATEGILVSPGPCIHRQPSSTAGTPPALEPFLAADIFTLQWHITQACDLHCRHCYDRSERTPMPYEKALAILDDLYDFCEEMHVRGQVTFTGGNPLLYPHFEDIYREASQYGFGVAILGNPAPIQKIEKLLTFAKPSYYQISLEGLQPHNDHIRGQGHFQRSFEFMDQLRSLDIYTMVMLTLSRDNIHQVLPLADLLKDRVDSFTFNRLSTVGEAAHLLMADIDAFQIFLQEYESAATGDSILKLKDNLINIIRDEKSQKPFGGCTGYGCGAAFNFLALLPDGEMHACRKFPSPVGNILKQRLVDIYGSRLAQNYRNGSEDCRDCRLNLVCRGCLAVTHSCGLDVFKDKDPFCFITEN